MRGLIPLLYIFLRLVYDINDPARTKRIEPHIVNQYRNCSTFHNSRISGVEFRPFQRKVLPLFKSLD